MPTVSACPRRTLELGNEQRRLLRTLLGLQMAERARLHSWLCRHPSPESRILTASELPRLSPPNEDP